MEKAQQMRGSQTPCQKYWPHLLDLVLKGKLDPTIVITHRPPLEEAPHAYKIFNEKLVRAAHCFDFMSKVLKGKQTFVKPLEEAPHACKIFNKKLVRAAPYDARSADSDPVKWQT